MDSKDSLPPQPEEASAMIDTPAGAAHRTALAQFESAADRLGLDDGLRGFLRAPKRELAVNFPVGMDDGSIRMFTGYRVQHNLARGPAKGWHSLSPRGEPGRGARPGDVDDVEVRGGQHPLRGSEGGSGGRPQESLFR